MPLTIYRRHATDCHVHQLKVGRRPLTDEEKRAYRECECAIWIYGTTEKNEQYPRRSLKTRDWPTAEARARSIDAGALDKAVYGPKIEECIQTYLDSCLETLNRANFAPDVFAVCSREEKIFCYYASHA